MSNLEKIMFPEHNKLIIDSEGTAKALIVDEELDTIECVFNNDNCVQLNTECYSYLTLSVDNLQQLIKLITKAEKHYNS